MKEMILTQNKTEQSDMYIGRGWDVPNTKKTRQKNTKFHLNSSPLREKRVHMFITQATLPIVFYPYPCIITDRGFYTEQYISWVVCDYMMVWFNHFQKSPP